MPVSMEKMLPEEDAGAKDDDCPPPVLCDGVTVWLAVSCVCDG